MTSSFTTRNRFNKQATGDGTNVWGDVLNAGVFDLSDFSLDGRVALTIIGNVTLTSANGTTDQARGRVLDLSGSVGATITVPALEKWYLVNNGSSADQIIASAGGGSSATVRVGEIIFVFCDAVNVKRLTLLSMESQKLSNLLNPTSNQDAATKIYVDNTAFNMAGGALPGQVGNAGHYLTTDGTTAAWSAAAFSANAAAVRLGTTTISALTPGDTYNALAEVALTDAATVAVDLSTGINFALNPIGGNRTLGNPTNVKSGQSGRIRIVQDGTGSRTLAFSGNWKRQGGAPTLSTAAGATDFIYYDAVSSTYILYDIRKSPT